MNFKAVLFDLDGTLLNTIEDLADSTNAALSRFGYPTHNLESYRYFIGSGVRNLIKKALPEKLQSNNNIIEQCLEEMRKQYSVRWADKTRPYNGIPELLNTLAQMGIKMCILSNKPDDFTQIIAAKLLSPWKFEEVWGERRGVPIKPDPTSAMKIAQLMGLHANDCIYLGDSGTDMQTGNAAGMYPVGAAWGFRTATELEEAGAKMIIYHPSELLKLF
jgi:phosphoglycolate phosphatase